MGKKAAAKGGKKVATAPLGAKSGKKPQKNPLFEKTPRNYRLGGDIQPKRDVARFTRWPKYIQLQRMKRILLQRLKVPPALNQFNMTIDKNQAGQLFRLLKKYQPETREEKKARLLETAQSKKDGKDTKAKKPVVLKYGLNHVTTLVENKAAKLVAIAHDVDPIELVVWLPALCRKKDVAYCIVKGKSRLGQLVHKKAASCVALTQVRKEEQGDLDNLIKNFKAGFNQNMENRRRWGGGIMGVKSNHIMAKREKMLQIEAAKKMGLGM
jgi:large subunit ribosomal protein L7Ae